jgi:hypothetical protein
MSDDKALTLGLFQHNPINLLTNGRFFCASLLDGAWLALYTPLDGAMLLTSAPPSGFIGVAVENLRSRLDSGLCQFRFPNLSGLELVCNIRSNGPDPDNNPAELILPPVQIRVNARNNTHNPLPVAIAFSWQDLQLKTPHAGKPLPTGMEMFFEDGVRLGLVCDHPRPHFTFCSGWDPAGSGEEIWDDFFAYGELSNQAYASFAGAVCALCLVEPLQNLACTFTLQHDPASYPV